MTIAAKMTINGKDADTTAHLTVTNPANGEVLGTAPDAGMAELDAAIAAARAAPRAVTLSARSRSTAA